MLLDEVVADVSSQVDTQRDLGVQITDVNDVPETGPANKGVWNRIPNVTAVFVDMKGSTAMNVANSPAVAARIYTYFVRAMSVVFERFGASYVDIQGDGLFGLFSGEGSVFSATACGITMRTLIDPELTTRLRRDGITDWTLAAGVGLDRGTLLVRRLGLRAQRMNEVWAGKPVNMASKLSSLANDNQVVVSDRVFQCLERAPALRRRCILWSCGCGGGVRGAGLDASEGETTYLWSTEAAAAELGLDFAQMHRLNSKWCSTHGSQFCEAIVTGRRPGG